MMKTPEQRLIDWALQPGRSVRLEADGDVFEVRLLATGDDGRAKYKRKRVSRLEITGARCDLVAATISEVLDAMNAAGVPG